MTNLFQHLTNYAINKNHEDFEENQDSGDDDEENKRSIHAVLQEIAEMGHDVNKLMNKISDMIVKTIISAHPPLSHQYRSA